MNVWKRKLLCFFCCLLVLFLISLLVCLTNADVAIRVYQKTGMTDGNPNKTSEDSGITTIAEDVVCHYGILYDDTYPNGFLDIYRDTTGIQHPVYVFVHGGGYAWGDKRTGDPLGEGAKELDGQTELFVELVRHGYTVVSVNYALVPDYRYPVPFLQLNNAFRFLSEHQDDWQLDMDAVILSGSSAGGHLAGQYAAAVSNDSYARQLDIVPNLSTASLRALVLRCALLEPENFDKVDTLLFKMMFHALKEGYFGHDQRILTEVNVTEHISSDFPPTYLTDGNHGTFDNQAKHAAAILSAKGVLNEFFYTPIETAQLEHGYDMDLANPFAEENLRRELVFIDAVLAA